MQSAVLIAFDWGTTHVRAALLDRTGMALEERRGKSGVGQVDENGYRAIFDDLTRGWPLVPALACGMVGSRQGWLEAPYIACPAGLDGLADGLARIDLSERVLAIVPGLKVDQPNQKDVMRGEETALAGIVARDPNASATVVMPGTQSALQRHEWVKHGSCYGDGSPEKYFADSLLLIGALNQSAVQDLFEAHIGQRVETNSIRDAFDVAFGAGAGDRVSVSCRRDGGRELITELLLHLEGNVPENLNLGELLQAAEPVRTKCHAGIVDPAGLQ